MRKQAGIRLRRWLSNTLVASYLFGRRGKKSPSKPTKTDTSSYGALTMHCMQRQNTYCMNHSGHPHPSPKFHSDHSNAGAVLAQLPDAFKHFNEIHPHSSLKWKSPSMFRRELAPGSGMQRKVNDRMCPVIRGKITSTIITSQLIGRAPPPTYNHAKLTITLTTERERSHSKPLIY